ncbi:hypothetical protein RU639_011332 [Aspergillus parasiticus]
MKEVLSPKKKVIVTRESDKYDPKEPFWKVVKINQALHLTKVKTLSAAEQLVETERDGVIDTICLDDIQYTRGSPWRISGNSMAQRQIFEELPTGRHITR